MEPLTIEATPAAPVELTPDELTEAARADHPAVVAELERLQKWCRCLVGREISDWNGKAV